MISCFKARGPKLVQKLNKNLDVRCVLNVKFSILQHQYLLVCSFEHPFLEWFNKHILDVPL